MLKLKAGNDRYARAVFVQKFDWGKLTTYVREPWPEKIALAISLIERSEDFELNEDTGDITISVDNGRATYKAAGTILDAAGEETAYVCDLVDSEFTPMPEGADPC